MSSSQNIDRTPAYTLNEIAKKKKAGIVVSGWHKEITDLLMESAKSTLLNAGLDPENILVREVPGAFELPLGAQYLLEYEKVDIIVALGCIVKGETPHFHYISEAVTLTLIQLQARANHPVGYGVLTVDTIEQAKERAGGKFGNKGEEAAQAALFMLSLKEDMKKSGTKSSIGFGAGNRD